MKKFVLMAVALFAVGCISAQNLKDEINKSKERAAKLEKLNKDYKTSGVANIDGYGNAIKEAAAFAIQNTNKLDSLYKRQIGETVNGVTDETLKKPSIDEWVSLATTVAGEGAKIKEATDKAKGAAEEAKNMVQNASAEKNPMKAAKEAKKAKLASAVIEFGNAATPILLEESAAQVKAINDIINTLKSGKNL